MKTSGSAKKSAKHTAWSFFFGIEIHSWFCSLYWSSLSQGFKENSVRPGVVKESAADAEAPETWCGLKTLPSFAALARESRSGAGNQVQFPGVPDPASSPKNIGFVPPLDTTQAQLSVPGRRVCEDAECLYPLFQFFWLHFLNPEDAGPRLLSVICQTFVQPQKGREDGY